MKIQTIHPAVQVGGTLVRFEPVGKVYEGEVDDTIGEALLAAAVKGDYIRLDGPGPSQAEIEAAEAEALIQQGRQRDGNAASDEAARTFAQRQAEREIAEQEVREAEERRAAATPQVATAASMSTADTKPPKGKK
jgi:hypothetical protein